MKMVRIAGLCSGMAGIRDVFTIAAIFSHGNETSVVKRLGLILADSGQQSRDLEQDPVREL